MSPTAIAAPPEKNSSKNPGELPTPNQIHERFLQEKIQAARPEAASIADRADAHHRQGLALVKDGRLGEAEREFRKAVRLRPDLADAHGNIGVVLARQGKLPEAEAAFQVAIRLQPTNATTYNNLATAFLQQGKPAEAESWARQALQLQPEGPESHFLLGNALQARNQPGLAEASYREAVRLKEDLPEAHYRLGNLLHKRDQYQEAEREYRAVLRFQPDRVEAWNGLGMVLEHTERAADARECYREALRRNPNDPDVHNNMGVALAALDKPEEAEACYREALRLRPKFAAAQNNLGNTLRMLDKLEDAAQSLEEALRIQPRYPEAHNNLGIVLVHQGRTEEGLKHYDEALRMRPEYPEARLNRSLAWLANGDFQKGWAEYEWRWQGRQLKAPEYGGKAWKGDLGGLGELAGRTILLNSEQGLGDTIHFVRYAGLLRGAGAKVIVNCPRILGDLAATCPGVAQVVCPGDRLPPFDYHAPLMSLPGLLGTNLDNVPGPIPYLFPEPGRIAHWLLEMEKVGGFRVGFCWQGSKKHRGDRQRSVPLSRFAALGEKAKVVLCSLQKGDGREQLGNASGILDLGGLTQESFGDCGALILSLHLVITIDSAVAHLAGALGMPVWVALPYAADWRWLRGRADTPWYPSMRLFRQPARGDWDSVFEEMGRELGKQTDKVAGEGAV